MPGQPGQAWPDPQGAPQAEPSDRDLLRRHTEGDTDAFGVLFLRHRDRLWAVALRTLGDQEEAADALQDAMISAFRRAADFRGDSAVTTWLHRIVVNACLDRIRRRAARPAASGMDEQTLDVLAQGSALADPGIDKDTALDVLAALRTLAPDQRAVLVMVDMLGYPVADTAEILGISPGTVKSRCARGRARLLPLLAHLRGSGAAAGDRQPASRPASRRPGGTSQPHRASHQPRERVRASHERARGRGVPGVVRRGSAEHAPERADPLPRGPLPRVRRHASPAGRGPGAAGPGPPAGDATGGRGPAGRGAQRRGRPPRRARSPARAGWRGARPPPGGHPRSPGTPLPGRPAAPPAAAPAGRGAGPGRGGRAGRRGRGGLRGGSVALVPVVLSGIQRGGAPHRGLPERQSAPSARTPAVVPGESGSAQFTVRHSRTRYRKDTFAAQAAALLSLPSAGPLHPGEVSGGQSRQGQATALTGCVDAVAGPAAVRAGDVKLVDQALYQGHPATVIVVQATPARPGTVYVAGTRCSSGTADILARAPLRASG